MEKGKFLDLEEDVYRAEKGWNYSLLKEFMKSPKHYKYALENPSQPTPSMVLGTAAHTAILQPQLFEKCYRIMPEGLDGRTAEAKALKKEAMEAGATLVDGCVLEMRDAVLENKEAAEIISHSLTERAIFWDNDYGTCKCKVDIWYEGAGILADLKTTDSVLPDDFANTVARLKYYIQAAHYIEGVKSTGATVKEYLIIALENKPPYDCVVYRLSEDAIKQGISILDNIYASLSFCEATGDWAGVSNRIENLELPKWAKI